MRQKVELNKVRNSEEIIDHSILFFKQNFKPLMKSYYSICGFFLVSGIIVSIFYQINLNQASTGRSFSFSSSFFLMMLFSFLNYLFIILTSFSFIALYKAKNNQPPNLEEVWSYVKFYFFRMLGSTLILGIGLIIGLFMCIVPGIYLWPIFSFIPAIMILENTSFNYGIQHAFTILKNNWGNLFGLLVLSFLLVMAAMFLLAIPVMIIGSVIVFLAGENQLAFMNIGFSISSYLAQFLLIFPSIVLSLFYYSLTEKEEGNDLLNRIKMLGTQPQQTQQSSEEEY